MHDMERRGWVDAGGAWVWKRRFLAWEEETVFEYASLLRNVVLQDHILDMWWWIIDSINGYSIKRTYNYLTMACASSECGLFDDLWQKQVPLKVSMFAW